LISFYADKILKVLTIFLYLEFMIRNIIFFVAGEYAMLEHENVKGVVESLKIVTASNTERLCR